MNSNGGPPSYSTATRHPPASANNTTYRGKVTKSFQVTGILHMIAGGMCVVMGIAAIVFKANLSYLAFPIWGGLLFFITTGIIGCAYYCKPKSKCVVIAYLVMSILSGIFAGGMFITYIVISSNEQYYNNDWYSNYCYPLWEEYCDIPVWPRLLMDILLCLIFFLELACGCTSLGMASYKACKCCRLCCSGGCCKDEGGSSNQAYYGVPMMSAPNGSTNRPIYVAGGSSQPGGQAVQMMVMAPAPQGQTFMAVQPGNQQVQPTQAQAQPAQFQTIQVQAQPPQAQAQAPQFQAQAPQVQDQQKQVQSQPQQVPAQPIQFYGQQFQAQPVAQIQTQPAQYQAQPFVQGQHFIQAPVQVQASSYPAQAQGGMVIAAAASPVYPTPMLAPGSQPPAQQQPPQQGPPQPQPPQQGSPQDQTKQDKAEEATETMEVMSGQTFSGQFSDQAALI